MLAAPGRGDEWGSRSYRGFNMSGQVGAGHPALTLVLTTHPAHSRRARCGICVLPAAAETPLSGQEMHTKAGAASSPLAQEKTEARKDA